MTKSKILIVVGTRPNFIKITQFLRVFRQHKQFQCKILHTQQHHDSFMSTVFFKQFGIEPDIYLDIEQGTQVTQVAEIIRKLEPEFHKFRPDLVVVVGDVNSTFAGAFTANRMGIKVGHVESGLRSFDRTMPEENNRILTDAISDYLFVTEKSGLHNLRREGIKQGKIFFVGNTMIDTLITFGKQIDASAILRTMNLEKKRYILMTMHRPATVDYKECLLKLIDIIQMVCKKYKVVFPIHPRTINKLKEFDLYDKVKKTEGLILAGPLDYFSFQKLIKECFCVVTDSGGIQEETTFLKVPCITLRPNTERPVTVTQGTNKLAPFNKQIIKENILSIEKGKYKKGDIPPLWDGHATERVVNILLNQWTKHSAF